MLARFGAHGILVLGSLAVCDNITTAFSDAMLARFGARGVLVLGSLAVCDNIQQHFLMQCLLGLVHVGSLCLVP